jgi:hypothetical protein
MRTKDEYEGVLVVNLDEFDYLKQLVTVELNFQNYLLKKYAPLEGDLSTANPVKARQAEHDYNTAKSTLEVLARYKTFSELEAIRKEAKKHAA